MLLFQNLDGNKNKKLLKRLNPSCPELRGVANPNQARYYCPFAVPARRSSMPGHRGFRMEKFPSSIFSEMTVKIYNFSSQLFHTIPELGRRNRKNPSQQS